MLLSRGGFRFSLVELELESRRVRLGEKEVIIHTPEWLLGLEEGFHSSPAYKRWGSYV